MIRIALFADVHGKVLLPFKLVDLYQNETGKAVDLILQCGDLGTFPDIRVLDKATFRFAQHDRDELGFHDDFVIPKPDIKLFLDQLNINMICVRGNHEDQDYLDQLEMAYPDSSCFPVDVYKRVWMCKSGLVQKFSANQTDLTFVGIGRIGNDSNKSGKQFIQEYEKQAIKRLLKSRETFDILISHDKDGFSRRGFGMEEIRNVLDNSIFHYFFHGHTGEPYSRETDRNGITSIVKIKELEFEKSGILAPGCMIILEKTADDSFKFEVMDQKFTNKLTRFNWRL